MDKLTDYIQITNGLPSDLCHNIIKEIDKKPWGKHEWYNVKEDYKNKNPHTSYDKELDVQHGDIETTQKLRPHVNKALKKYYNMFSDYGIFSRFSDIRFNKYQPGALMLPHIDHIHSLFDGKIKGIPVLSIVGCLNDDFEGADFILCGKKLDLKKGDILLFPSNFMYPHQVTEPTKGMRYSFVAWAF